MTTKERYDGVIAWFSEHMPVAESELHYTDPYQLLVAVILSAQCTDKRVNMTTPALFERFPTPFEMAKATAEEIYPYIRSISYPNNKARNLAGMARMLCEEFGGEVPSDLQQMQRLPGVGRKTANVLGAVLWQKEVMPVDTHVFRVSNRIGLTTNSKTPLQTELTLEKNIPSHLLPVAPSAANAGSPPGAANTPPTTGRKGRCPPPTFWGVCPGRLCRDGSFPDRHPRPIDSPLPVRPASCAGHDPAAGDTLNTKKTDQPNPNLRPMTKIVLKFLLLLFVPFFAQARDTDSLRVLWVGNSYTYYNDMPSTVRQIAATQKVKLSCTRFLKGGERLSGHLKNQKLLDAIAAGGWDYVILQEQSSAPAMPTRQVAREVYPAARTLDSLVHVASPDARVIFYMTWGHKNGNRFPIPEYPPANSYGTMQERLITSYLEMAYDNDAWCAPVGMAWRRVRAERPDYVLYAQDCFHPGPLGSYLAANVIFTTIYGKPYQTACTLDFPAEQAEYIQRVAQQTVLENLTLLNIKR